MRSEEDLRDPQRGNDGSLNLLTILAAQAHGVEISRFPVVAHLAGEVANSA
jgi:hypothetical protein